MLWHKVPNLAIVSSLGDKYAESDAGWSSLAARRAHNPKVTGSNPVPATNILNKLNFWIISGLALFKTLFNKMNDW